MTACHAWRRTATVGLAVLLAVALTACAPNRSAGGDDPPVGTPEPVADTPELPTVVGLESDAVVEVDPASGDVVSRHEVPAGDELADLELVRARGVAVVAVPTADGGSELVEVSLGDGSTRVLGPGQRPAVTADGSRLAFARTVEDGDRRELVATTWEGTELGAWPIAESVGEDVEVLDLGWSGTGDELVVTLAAAGGPQVVVLPIDRSGTLRGAGERVPPPSVGAILRAGTFRQPGMLSVAEGCCGENLDRWRILEVTLGTDGTAELLADLPGPVQHLDWSIDRRHLLLTLDTTPPRVVRWHASDPVDVVEGVTSAEW